MDDQKSHTESAPTPTVTSCRKMKSDSDNASSVINLRDHFKEFIHAPMEEHKACLKTTFQKIVGKFAVQTFVPKEDENSAPFQTTVLARTMDAQKSHTESAPTPTITSCRKKKSDSDNASFVTNLRDHFKEFIHAPMEEHKACLKTIFQKIAGKFVVQTSAPKED